MSWFQKDPQAHLFECLVTREQNSGRTNLWLTRLEGVALLEKACREIGSLPSSIYSLSILPPPACTLPSPHQDSDGLSTTVSKDRLNAFFVRATVAMASLHSNKTLTRTEFSHLICLLPFSCVYERETNFQSSFCSLFCISEYLAYVVLWFIL